MRAFIKAFNEKQLNSKKSLYAEAETSPANTEEVVEEPIIEEETVVENQEVNNNNDNNEELTEDFSDFNFDNPEINADANAEEDTQEGSMDEDNMFKDGEDEDTPEFRRKVRQLNQAYVNLYNKYRGVIDALRSRDLTGDKALVVNEFINEYEDTLQKLVAYQDSNSDPYPIRFKTFIELRTAFILINSKLETVEKDVALLS